jgi:hypothetical protein
MRNLDYWPPPEETIISYDWTAEQAKAVVELLEDLAEVIWARYSSVIASQCYPRPGPPRDAEQLGLPFPPSWDDVHCQKPGDDDFNW